MSKAQRSTAYNQAKRDGSLPTYGFASSASEEAFASINADVDARIAESQITAVDPVSTLGAM